MSNWRKEHRSHFNSGLLKFFNTSDITTNGYYLLSIVNKRCPNLYVFFWILGLKHFIWLCVASMVIIWTLANQKVPKSFLLYTLRLLHYRSYEILIFFSALVGWTQIDIVWATCCDWVYVFQNKIPGAICYLVKTGASICPNDLYELFVYKFNFLWL